MRPQKIRTGEASAETGLPVPCPENLVLVGILMEGRRREKLDGGGGSFLVISHPQVQIVTGMPKSFVLISSLKSRQKVPPSGMDCASGVHC